ncbi:hypothetical protein ACJIZ3_021588 [Penstemon smallii]|uniref:Uncharacterized protein n=1 Tax=Penstemon smallii TaxID=265156 RepID=A0ABD3SLW0_9LAMI
MVITEFAIKLLRDIKSQSHFFFFISFSCASQSTNWESCLTYAARISSFSFITLSLSFSKLRTT